MKCGKLGFTMVEILTVVGIIAILIAVLVPTLTKVRRIGKETQQKAQLTAIDLALIAFRSDYGDYPPSFQQDEVNEEYPGAQRLAEALLGQRLLGFHRNSRFRRDGMNPELPPPYNELYPEHINTSNPVHIENLQDRRGPYLELATANAFRLGDLFGGSTGLLDPDRLVICDSFGVRRITLADGRTVRAGTPILYYRANTAMMTMESGTWSENRYNFEDNMVLVDLGQISDGTAHRLSDPDVFYSDNGGVVDPQVTTMPWPYRPDSYILISAGADGLYGTSDDICNF